MDDGWLNHFRLCTAPRRLMRQAWPTSAVAAAAASAAAAVAAAAAAAAAAAEAVAMEFHRRRATHAWAHCCRSASDR